MQDIVISLVAAVTRKFISDPTWICTSEEGEVTILASGKQPRNIYDVSSITKPYSLGLKANHGWRFCGAWFTNSA